MAETGVFAEVFLWRFCGAACWHAVLFFLTGIGWAVLLPSEGFLAAIASCFTLTNLSAYLFLYGLQFSVLFAQRMVMSATEAPPFQISQIGLQGRSWPALLLSRVLLRGRSLTDLIGLAALLGSTSISAGFFLYSYPRLKLGSTPGLSFTFSFYYGIILGLLYSVLHLARTRDVLVYPPVQRHRWFRIKQRLTSLLGGTLRITLLALAITLVRGHQAGNFSGLLAHVHAATLCIFGWLLGQSILEVVFTERLKLAQPGHPNPNTPLLAALGHSNEIIQDLALMDLAGLSEERGSAASSARRAAIFADESGRTAWTPLASFLLVEVRNFTTALAAALPTFTGDAAKASGPKVQWNAVSLAVAMGAKNMSKEQDMAAWNVRSKYFRMGWCVRSLGGLAAASRTEDRYGVVLLCDPNLADVVTSLLSMILVLQQYTKRMSAAHRSTGLVGRAVRRLSRLLTGGSPGPVPTLQRVEHSAFALEDLTRTTVHWVVAAFGPSLRSALKEVKQKPVYGSQAEIDALLNAFISYQE